jgi:hypothetical protein
LTVNLAALGGDKFPNTMLRQTHHGQRLLTLVFPEIGVQEFLRLLN